MQPAAAAEHDGRHDAQQSPARCGHQSRTLFVTAASHHQVEYDDMPPLEAVSDF
jgi:hypothetical protein